MDDEGRRISTFDKLVVTLVSTVTMSGVGAVTTALVRQVDSNYNTSVLANTALGAASGLGFAVLLLGYNWYIGRK